MEEIAVTQKSCNFSQNYFQKWIRTQVEEKGLNKLMILRQRMAKPFQFNIFSLDFSLFLFAIIYQVWNSQENPLAIHLKSTGKENT